jgi:hypothetical protein
MVSATEEDEDAEMGNKPFKTQTGGGLTESDDQERPGPS